MSKPFKFPGTEYIIKISSDFISMLKKYKIYTH